DDVGDHRLDVHGGDQHLRPRLRAVVLDRDVDLGDVVLEAPHRPRQRHRLGDAQVLVDGDEGGDGLGGLQRLARVAEVAETPQHVDQELPLALVAGEVVDAVHAHPTPVFHLLLGVAAAQPGQGVGAIGEVAAGGQVELRLRDRKSTRLNSSHVKISYAVFCLIKKKNIKSTSSR